MDITCPTCNVCGDRAVLRGVDALGVFEWQVIGKNIQDALPELTDGDRELLITGTHPQCWDIMFDEATY